MILPVLKVFAESFSSAKYVDARQVLFWPKGWTIKSYQSVLGMENIQHAFFNSVFVTVVATAFNLLMTVLLAYPTSRPEYKYKKSVLLMITITMIVSAPLIPTYMLVKNMGMVNKLSSVIIPGAISAFYFHVQRSFFTSIPNDLVEAGRIDGCSEMGILFKLVLPLSKASLAAIGLFYAVDHWNSFFWPLIYLQKPNMQTLQIKLYQLIANNNDISVDAESAFAVSQESVKMTTIMVATIPILCIYPFLQKHFVKGVTLGSVKG
jgi:multiple sugar transport system permease protein/putative aldouronate transport system permease protein